jgi:hypothetical protein
MRRHWYTVFAVFCAFLRTVPIASGQEEDTGKAYDQISELIVTKSVSRVSIIHVPTRIETRTAINQQTLRRLSRIEVSLTNLQEGGLLDTLQSSLGELKTAASSPQHEVRWGILFFDARGKERAAIFLDSTGQFAQVGELRLRVEGKMLVCAKNMIDDELR